MTLDEQYKLSTYKEISLALKSSSKKICVVIDETTNKLYMMKVLLGTEYYSFFVRLASMNFRNLTKIHEVICHDGYTYIIEEYISGQTLQELMSNEGILPEYQAKDYILQLCDALIYLHSQNPPIIHRDIKPDNIMLTSDNIIKLLDFDIAREYKQTANRDTIFMGTKEYAAPEQYGFKQTDERTDIYAIGVLLHEMLTGRLPQNNIIYSGPLQKIIIKCLQLEPEKRYENVAALKKALLNTDAKRRNKLRGYALSAVVAIAAISILFPRIFNSIYNADQPESALGQTETTQNAYQTNGTIKKDATVTITSDDGRFTAEIPYNWEVTDPTSYFYTPSADLQAWHDKVSSYLIMYTYNKNDYEYDFDEWSEVALSDVIDNYKKRNISEPTYIDFNGRKGVQYTVASVSEKIKYKTLLTYIEGETYFACIMCDSVASNYENAIVVFNNIIYSLKGL